MCYMVICRRCIKPSGWESIHYHSVTLKASEKASADVLLGVGSGLSRRVGYYSTIGMCAREVGLSLHCMAMGPWPCMQAWAPGALMQWTSAGGVDCLAQKAETVLSSVSELCLVWNS